jgi:hypothetical protein
MFATCPAHLILLDMIIIIMLILTWRMAAILVNKQSWTDDNGWSSSSVVLCVCVCVCATIITKDLC